MTKYQRMYKFVSKRLKVAKANGNITAGAFWWSQKLRVMNKILYKDFVWN